MHVDLLIVSEAKFPKNFAKPLTYLQIPQATILDHRAITDAGEIYFDYLIITEKIIPFLLTEHGFIITNASLETSLEGVFAVGKKVKTKKSLKEQLKTIMEQIKNEK